MIGGDATWSSGSTRSSRRWRRAWPASPPPPAAKAATHAPSRATCTAGPSGAGHFVKMIHNGIEYGMMQAFAEGFDILQATPNSPAAAGRAALRPRPRRHRRGLAARQRRLARGCSTSPRRRWPKTRSSPATPATSPTPAKAAGPSRRPSRRPCRPTVLTAALFARFRSRQDHTFAEKVLSAMRKGFGGHVEAAKSDAGKSG